MPIVDFDCIPPHRPVPPVADDVVTWRSFGPYDTPEQARQNLLARAYGAFTRTGTRKPPVAGGPHVSVAQARRIIQQLRANQHQASETHDEP